MQTALLLLIGIAIVTASFALILSILDHGVTATVLEVVTYIDPERLVSVIPCQPAVRRFIECGFERIRGVARFFPRITSKNCRAPGPQF
jgi:hypothetical protein